MSAPEARGDGGADAVRTRANTHLREAAERTAMQDTATTNDRIQDESAWAVRRLTTAYAIGLSLIAIVASIIWYISIAMVSAQGQVAAEVNVAGRQRMLTQKVALLTATLQTATGTERKALVEEASACLDFLEQAHAVMLSRDVDALKATAAEGIDCRPGTAPRPPVGAMSTELETAYFGGLHPVDALLSRYIALGRDLTALPATERAQSERLQRAIFLLANTDLPRQLDLVAHIIQREGEAQIDRLVAAKTAMWGATLLLLILEVILIFRPMARRIRRTIRTVRDMAAALAEHRRNQEDLYLANKAKTRFLAQMSHELRTPLNAIIGYSQLLEAADTLNLPPEKRREYAGDIKASGDHLLSLVNDLLDLSRIEADSIVVNRQIADIGRIVGGVAAMMRTHAAHRQQQIVVRRADFPVSARVDERLLRQALINLVDNALKYGRDSGSVRIDFSQPAQDHVEIAVEDDGIGFDMAALPVLLEPFERVESDPTLAPDGIGLGLPLAHRLINLQDGSLTLTSEPGVGTRAVVCVPSVEKAFVSQRTSRRDLNAPPGAAADPSPA